MNAQGINTSLKSSIDELCGEFDSITNSRKEELKELAELIMQDRESFGHSKLIFVCTHNSRRSQLSEIWFRAAAWHYGIDKISAFSGGTESTAFNHRMVAAIKRAGFLVEKIEDGDNPVYRIPLSEHDSQAQNMFSKKYDHPFNPDSAFIAVMVCGQADQDCPFVPGASARMALPYEDPKHSDNTPEESAVYDAKVREIGREILYLGYLLTH